MKRTRQPREPGEARCAEYRVWSGMIQRCTNPKRHNYCRYGGRGIRVAEEWLGSYGYDAFLAHVGRRPSPAHKLERIDNNGNYEPGNVTWATNIEQCNNIRKNRIITVEGVSLTMAEWGRALGIRPQVISNRIHQMRWDEVVAVTKPVQKRAPRRRRVA